MDIAKYLPAIFFGLVLAAAGSSNPRLAENEVALYRDGNCSGAYIKLGKGDYSDLQSLPGASKAEGQKENWNDQVSCIQLGTKAKVTVYEHTNFKGASKTLQFSEKNQGKISFAGSNWDRRISSAKVILQ
jgi:hypothetical protein